MSFAERLHALLLEAHDRAPGVMPITTALEEFDLDHVHAAWQKALDRRLNDPEGAITAARMLLETVCKYILDEAVFIYPDNADLPKLWALAAELLNLECPLPCSGRELRRRQEGWHGRGGGVPDCRAVGLAYEG